MDRRQAFEAAALPHMAAAFTLAYWLVKNRADAEDVVQEAYIRAYRAFDDRHGDVFKPWLLAIVRNCAFTHLGQRRRANNVVSFEEAFQGRDNADGLEQIADGAATAEETLAAADDHSAVMAALADLPPLYREVLILREVEESSYKDIASLTGVPIGTVMSRLSRAREKLSQVFLARAKKEERYK